MEIIFPEPPALVALAALTVFVAALSVLGWHRLSRSRFAHISKPRRVASLVLQVLVALVLLYALAYAALLTFAWFSVPGGPGASPGPMLVSLVATLVGIAAWPVAIALALLGVARLLLLGGPSPPVPVPSTHDGGSES